MAPQYNLQYVTKDYPFMTCLVKVNTLFSWHKNVAKVLNNCQGIRSFRMNEDGLVEISGMVDPNLLLKMLGKSGRKAELKWFQFGECSSNLFMPTTQSTIVSGYGGAYSRDGRYLHSDNLHRPKLPSHDALVSSAGHQKHDYQIAYGNSHDYADPYSYHNNQGYQLGYGDQHGYGHNQGNQLGYGENHDYQHGYGHNHDYQHGYDHNNGYNQAYDHGHGYQDKNVYGHATCVHDTDQIDYQRPLRNLPGEDIECCTIM